MFGLAAPAGLRRLAITFRRSLNRRAQNNHWEIGYGFLTIQIYIRRRFDFRVEQAEIGALTDATLSRGVWRDRRETRTWRGRVSRGAPAETAQVIRLQTVENGEFTRFGIGAGIQPELLVVGPNHGLVRRAVTWTGVASVS